MSKNNPNLYLLGFMGTGKSSLGKRLATALNMHFLDSDLEIEKAQDMTIEEIFKSKGEEYFRQLEKSFIENGHPNYNCVVSCGGGIVCRDNMPELIKTKGVCVVLFSPPEVILQRISQHDNRPLLKCENPLEKIKELLAIRTPYYLNSGIAIETDSNIKITQEHIMRIYKRYKADFHKKNNAQ